MKILIRQRDGKLTETERSELERRLGVVLARFCQRIGRVTVQLSDAEGAPGYKRCRLDVGIDDDHVIVEDSDVDIFRALEHAAIRAARSVSRAIEKQSWSSRR